MNPVAFGALGATPVSRTFDGGRWFESTTDHQWQARESKDGYAGTHGFEDLLFPAAACSSGIPGYARSARNTSSTSFPYFRSFDSPTPDTRSSSVRFAGRADAIAASVASWKTTYAGTPPARAVSSRQRRNRSSVSTGTSVRWTEMASAGSVSVGTARCATASRPADVISTTGYSPEL